MTGPQVQMLADGRLHLNHGPIDLIIGADGGRDAAYDRAIARFDGLLAALVDELPALRSGDDLPVRGAVAQAMARAVAVHRPAFITPMAAVAGAVADAVLAAMLGPDVRRAYVNNGGDIALHLTAGQSYAVAMAGGRLVVQAADPVRGIATSGWRGRSWSLGIADQVTVLAENAAMADAAATMIANAVDLPGHLAIDRRPAVDMQADSDLGARLVTVAVGALPPDAVALALQRGAAHARGLQARGIIAGAALFLQGQAEIIGTGMTLAQPTERRFG